MKVIKVKLSKLGMKRIIETKTNIDYIDKKFQECLWKYAIYSKNINRCFVSCPFCNGNNSFRKMSNFKGSKTCKLIYSYEGAMIKVGNAIMFIVSEDGKLIYEVPDLYLHFFIEHNMVPNKKFKNAVIYGLKPETEQYYECIKKFLFNKNKEKRIIENKKCSFCGELFQGQIAYKVDPDYKNVITSYESYSQTFLSNKLECKYICYRCGHYT